MREARAHNTAPAVASGNARPAARPKPLIHAFLFVFGFSIVFVSLGTAVSSIGQLAFDLREPLARIGGVVVILFGLVTMGLFGALSRRLSRFEDSTAGGIGISAVGWVKSGIDFSLRYFHADTRTYLGRGQGNGYTPSFLMGVFFSAGWTPCIGPTLGAILALGYSTATISQGVLLLSGYSLGLGIPFILFALALDRASSLLGVLKRHIRAIQLINGILLILIGVVLLTKQLALIARWAQENGLYLEAGSLGEATPTFFIAVLAGLLSFLSPCVLPLVPAYVFYLTGHTFSKAAMTSRGG